MTATSPHEVLDRGGHLSELTLDRFRFDPPEPAFQAAVRAHLETCGACRGALEALVASDAELVLAPPLTGGAVVALPRRRPIAWIATAVVLATAALALLVVRPWRPDDVVTLKGSPFDFEVHVHDGRESRPVLDGDTVHPGERMGFRVHLRQDGYLAVIGRDDRGMTYPCYPPADVGAPVAATIFAVAHPRTEHPETLPVAMRFDDTLGDEHITAVFCREPFSLGSDVAAATQGLSQAGCAVTTLTLHKVAAPGGTP
jgi:hypothetical protein